MASKISFRPNLLEFEEKFGFCSLLSPFWGPEAGVLKITKNSQKRPQIPPATSLMNFSSKNNCKQCLEIQKIHFQTFLAILGHF